MMKKILYLGICLLLIGMPLATAISSQSTTTFESKEINIGQETKTIAKTGDTRTTDTPPAWANGNFSGLWGYSIWGEWEIPVGWMFGYYKRETNFGYFYAGLIIFGEENISFYLQGFIFGPFMFGSIGENESANETLFVGIGRYNETSYHWRVMGEIGPTFFMKGAYTKFE